MRNAINCYKHPKNYCFEKICDDCDWSAVHKAQQKVPSELSDGLDAEASFANCIDVLRDLVGAVAGQAIVTGKESIRVKLQRKKAEAYLKAQGI